ncbi:hypothetical protein [Phaeocystidibacter marisrubri]|uniref:Outer membrane beta-barrel protein n=1 Tax=Phaeocystidibacter marisrubri TaxID=1577780 RepID=A0A6L3ZIX2_9FLAO|nr:hypothetical protein [Phaeocystidibacter marisrubri]KAB2817831.1 hypothetical protein F8C82_05355 [Phaeocystidibacter marisrubri]GGH73299.1 hypothetical protein GCM10011318_18190 [Phaeocystidibacter marisrubri]
MKRGFITLFSVVSLFLHGQEDDYFTPEYLPSYIEMTGSFEMGYTTSSYPILEDYSTDGAAGFYTDGITYGARIQIRLAQAREWYGGLSFQSLSTPLGNNRRLAVTASIEAAYPGYTVREITVTPKTENGLTDINSYNSAYSFNFYAGYGFRKDRICIGLEGGLQFTASQGMWIDAVLKEQNTNNEFRLEQYGTSESSPIAFGPGIGVDLSYRINRLLEVYGHAQFAFTWYHFTYEEYFTDIFNNSYTYYENEYSGQVNFYNIMAGVRYCIGR